MNNTYALNRIKRMINELKTRYIKENYELLSEIPQSLYPHFSSRYRPDIIAKKGDELIIAEVKSNRLTSNQKREFEEMARNVKNLPGVKFNLVLVDTRAPTTVYDKMERVEVALSTIIDGLLDDAKHAIDTSNVEIIPIILYRILETLLIRLAYKEGIYVPINKSNLRNLNNSLYKEKLISPNVHSLVKNILKLRDSAMHTNKYPESLITNNLALDYWKKIETLATKWSGNMKRLEEIECPVCGKDFNSYLNLARHMVLKDRPEGNHIQYLESIMGKPFVEFGWKSDKKIAVELKKHMTKHNSD